MNILSRVKKIEATMQQSMVGAVLLREPSHDDGDEIRAHFETKLANAIEVGQQVVVHTSGKEPIRRIAGVIYESNIFVANLALAAHTPATDGSSPDKLSQIVSEVQGTPLPVFKGIRNG